MSYYAQFDSETEDYGYDVATNQGWRDMTQWVESLEALDELTHLVLYGWSQELSTLTDELTAALKSRKIKASVKSTATGLLDLLLGRPKDCEVIVITDGCGAEEWSAKRS